MSLKTLIRKQSKKNKKLSRQYDKLTWYKSKLNAIFESDRHFAIRTYKKKFGKVLNLDNPCTFDEKLWWLKLNNRAPLLTICSDKYLVREYVRGCDLGHILNELYGVYDDAREIDFDSLPDEVFFKCNHTSGINRIYDKNVFFDKEDFIQRFNFVLKQNYYTKSREWNYKNIKPLIICERVLKQSDGTLPIVDYKFLCFAGEPKLLLYETGLCKDNGEHAGKGNRKVLDMNFMPVDIKFITIEPFGEAEAEKPVNLNQMVEYAKIISKPFPICRVDLYNIDGSIFFGEITFYPWGGYNNIHPEEWATILGDWIDIYYGRK